MPRAKIPCANPKCGRLRMPGGKSNPAGLCRLCWHQALLAKSPEERKRGPYKTAASKPAPKPKAPPVVNEQADGEPPWWSCPRSEWSDRISDQMPRFRVAGIGRDRPAIGSSLATD